MPLSIDVVQTGRDPVAPDSLNIGTIRALQLSLPDALRSNTVFDLIAQIRSRVSRAPQENGRPAPIARLRFYGHGSSGQQYIAGGRAPADDQVIGVSGAELLNAVELSMLSGCFSSDARVELHGCNVGAGSPGRLLIYRLAKIWQASVWASSIVQTSSTAGDLAATALQGPIIGALYSPTGINYSHQQPGAIPETEIIVPGINAPSR